MKIAKIVQTCIACPSQWEGEFEDGSKLYIRYRHGTLRVEKGDKLLFSATFGDSLDGFIDLDTVLLKSRLTLAEGVVCEQDNS